MSEKKDIFSLIGFSSIGNILPIVTLPFLVKLYSPSDFGEVTLYTTFLVIFSNILSLKYDQAILVSKNEEETITLFFLSFFLTVLTSVLLLVIAYVSSLFFNFSTDTIVLIFFGVIFQFLISTIFIYHNRNMSIRQMNLSKILPLTLYVVVAFILYFLNFNLDQPLVYSRLISLVISVFILRFFMNRNFNEYHFSMEKFKIAMKDYISYPKNILPSKAINMISNNSLEIFISAVFGNAMLGIFSISRRLVSIPEMIISRPLESYFRRKVFINNDVDLVTLRSTFFKYLKNLSITSIPIFLSLVFVAPKILPYIFVGKEWGSIIPVIVSLSLGYTISFIVIPFMSVFRILKREKYEMLFQFVFFFTMALLYISIITFDIKFNDFIELFNIKRIIVFVFCMILVLKLILKKERS